MTNNTFEFEYKGENKTISVKSELNCSESMSFMISVIYNIFANAGSPVLYLKDLFIKKNIIQHYSDFEMPLDIDECFDIVYNTSLHDEVEGRISNHFKYEILLKGLDEQIEFEKQKAANRSSIDNLLDTINEVIKKIDGNIDIKNISGLLEKIQKIEKIDEKTLAEAVMSFQKPVKKGKKKVGG